MEQKQQKAGKKPSSVSRSLLPSQLRGQSQRELASQISDNTKTMLQLLSQTKNKTTYKKKTKTLMIFKEIVGMVTAPASLKDLLLYQEDGSNL